MRKRGQEALLEPFQDTFAASHRRDTQFGGGRSTARGATSTELAQATAQIEDALKRLSDNGAIPPEYLVSRLLRRVAQTGTDDCHLAVSCAHPCSIRPLDMVKALELEIFRVDQHPTAREIRFRGQTWYDFELSKPTSAHSQERLYTLKSRWRDAVLATYDLKSITPAGQPSCSYKKLFHHQMSHYLQPRLYYKRNYFELDGRRYGFVSHPMISDYKVRLTHAKILSPLIIAELMDLAKDEVVCTFCYFTEALTARRRGDDRLFFKRGKAGTVVLDQTELFLKAIDEKGSLYEPTAFLDAAIQHWLAYSLYSGDSQVNFAEETRDLELSKNRGWGWTPWGY